MKRIPLIGLLLLLQAGAHAQKVGTTSLQFLKVMPTARATALGEAFAAQATGADAMFWNPAGLAATRNYELTSTMTIWIFDTQQSALALAADFGEWGAVGLQFQYVDFGDIEETSVDNLGFVGSGGNLQYNPGLTGRTFSPSSYLIGISYARQLTALFSAGFSVKFARENLWDESTTTVPVLDASGNVVGQETYNTFAQVFMVDFGMRYNTGFRSVQLGVSVQNLGGSVRFAQEGSPAPLTFRLGATANLIGTDALLLPMETHRLTTEIDLMQPNDYDQQVHLGLEYSFSEVLALRGGYKFNYDADGLTAGAGVHTTLAGLGLMFDYSFGSMGTYLGNVHRISLGVNFQ